MTKSRCLVVRLSLYLLTVCPFLLAVGCGTYIDINRSYSENTFTGTFGYRQLEGADAVKDFNLSVIKWFIGRGFVDIQAITYGDLVDHPEFDLKNKSGVLLLSNHNHQNLVYVFVPDSYNPDKNIQIIGYHVALKGTLEEVKGYRDDFHKLEGDFVKEFLMLTQPVVIIE